MTDTTERAAAFEMGQMAAGRMAMTEVRLYYITCKGCGKFLIGAHPLYCGPCYEAVHQDALRREAERRAEQADATRSLQVDLGRAEARRSHEWEGLTARAEQAEADLQALRIERDAAREEEVFQRERGTEWQQRAEQADARVEMLTEIFREWREGHGHYPGIQRCHACREFRDRVDAALAASAVAAE